MARAGIIVISPDYNDKMNLCRINESKEVPLRTRLQLLREAKEVVGKLREKRDEFAYRPREARALISAVRELVQEKKVFFGDCADLDRLGAAGHSLGAFTTLSISGAWKQYDEPGLRSALVLSIGNYFNDEELKNVRLPAMFIAGEKEEDRADAARNMYGKVSGLRFRATVKNANHFSFSDPETMQTIPQAEIDKMADSIAHCSLHFFKFTLDEKFNSMRILEKPSEYLTEYHFDFRQPSPGVFAGKEYGIGVNIHFTNDTAALDNIKAAGFNFIRMDLVWSVVEKEKGKYDFVGTGYDGLTAGCVLRQIGMLYILDYTNYLYEKGNSIVTEDGRTAFANFSKSASERYRGQIGRAHV
jgi:hypothetical protein